MSYADDLLEQAHHLLGRDGIDARQASLRRAVSAAYYALFHAITERAGAVLLRDPVAEPYRPVVARLFEHRQMKQAADAFKKGQVTALLTQESETVSPDLQRVAQAFRVLQDARHLADYDLRLASDLTYRQTDAYVRQTDEALAAWQRVSHDEALRFVLACLGAGRR